MKRQVSISKTSPASARFSPRKVDPRATTHSFEMADQVIERVIDEGSKELYQNQALSSKLIHKHLKQTLYHGLVKNTVLRTEPNRDSGDEGEGGELAGDAVLQAIEDRYDEPCVAKKDRFRRSGVPSRSFDARSKKLVRVQDLDQRSSKALKGWFDGQGRPLNSQKLRSAFKQGLKAQVLSIVDQSRRKSINTHYSNFLSSHRQHKAIPLAQHPSSGMTQEETPGGGLTEEQQEEIAKNIAKNEHKERMKRGLREFFRNNYEKLIRQINQQNKFNQLMKARQVSENKVTTDFKGRMLIQSNPRSLPLLETQAPVVKVNPKFKTKKSKVPFIDPDNAAAFRPRKKEVKIVSERSEPSTTEQVEKEVPPPDPEPPREEASGEKPETESESESEEEPDINKEFGRILMDIVRQKQADGIKEKEDLLDHLFVKDKSPSIDKFLDYQFKKFLYDRNKREGNTYFEEITRHPSLTDQVYKVPIAKGVTYRNAKGLVIEGTSFEYEEKNHPKQPPSEQTTIMAMTSALKNFNLRIPSAMAMAKRNSETSSESPMGKTSALASAGQTQVGKKRMSLKQYQETIALQNQRSIALKSRGLLKTLDIAPGEHLEMSPTNIILNQTLKKQSSSAASLKFSGSVQEITSDLPKAGSSRMNSNINVVKLKKKPPKAPLKTISLSSLHKVNEKTSSDSIQNLISSKKDNDLLKFDLEFQILDTDAKLTDSLAKGHKKNQSIELKHRPVERQIPPRPLTSLGKPKFSIPISGLHKQQGIAESARDPHYIRVSGRQTGMLSSMISLPTSKNFRYKRLQMNQSKTAGAEEDSPFKVINDKVSSQGQPSNRQIPTKPKKAVPTPSQGFIRVYKIKHLEELTDKKASTEAGRSTQLTSYSPHHRASLNDLFNRKLIKNKEMEHLGQSMSAFDQGVEIQSVKAESKGVGEAEQKRILVAQMKNSQNLKKCLKIRSQVKK